MRTLSAHTHRSVRIVPGNLVLRAADWTAQYLTAPAPKGEIMIVLARTILGFAATAFQNTAGRRVRPQDRNIATPTTRGESEQEVVDVPSALDRPYLLPRIQWRHGRRSLAIRSRKQHDRVPTERSPCAMGVGSPSGHSGSRTGQRLRSCSRDSRPRAAISASTPAPST
jgi:hypothetical protein